MGSVPPHVSHHGSCPAGGGTGPAIPAYVSEHSSASVPSTGHRQTWHRQSPVLSWQQQKGAVHCGKPLMGQILPLPTLCSCLAEILTVCSVETLVLVPTWVAGAAGMGHGLSQGIEKGPVFLES